MSTIDRLVAALEAAGAPRAMITAARAGCYDDFRSESDTPILDLVRDCNRAGLHDLAKRAIGGEFDATGEEADAWAAAHPEIVAQMEALGLLAADEDRRR